MMHGLGNPPAAARSNHGRAGRVWAARHGFSHPLVVELLEERMPLNSNPMADFAAVPTAQAPTGAPMPSAQAGKGTAGDLPNGGQAPPISASNSPAVLLFDPHQPTGMVPADVTSGSGPPLQQGAPPRFSYNLETNITGEGDGADNEPLTAPSHSGSVTPNGVPGGEAGRGLPFDVNQAAATPAGIPRFSFGPQTAPRSPLENRDLPGMRPGTSPSSNNRTNPTQPPESAPGTQPVIPSANQGARQEAGASDQNIAAAPAANDAEFVMAEERVTAEHALAIDIMAADLAAVIPLNQHSTLAGEATTDRPEPNSLAGGAAAPAGDVSQTNDPAPSAEGALISGAMLTAVRTPRPDAWPLDSVRRAFQGNIAPR